MECCKKERMDSYWLYIPIPAESTYLITLTVEAEMREPLEKWCMGKSNHFHFSSYPVTLYLNCLQLLA